MHPVLSAIADSPILWIILNATQAILYAAMIYFGIFYPRSETGFYSWHPVKRILFLLFLPFVLLFKLIAPRCHCGCCCHCQDDD